MEAEIVYSGLCSILNPDGTKTADMGDPAVILVQTPLETNEDENHVAYVAFNGDEVTVVGATPLDVPEGRPFVYIPIDEVVELQVKGQAFAAATTDDMYRQYVAHRDLYWPAEKMQFNRDFVPLHGDRPKKTAVKVWMRFCGGRLTASRISQVPWRFRKNGALFGERITQCFAEEIVYDGFPHDADALVIQRCELESGAYIDEWRFTATTPTLTLIIGNNMIDDMAGSALREVTKFVKKPKSRHFRYINRTGVHGDGPIPRALNPRRRGKPAAGGSGGTCGPGSGNGGG